MKTIHERIYEKAKPYLDTRQNEVHIAISLAFTLRLLSYYPDANEDVVIPAIILHDVGWKAVPEEKQLGAFGPNMKDEESRRLHEIEGARVAKEILDAVGYGEEETREIIAIIDGHDSRPEALSLNDSLVKDADKLWRFSPVGVNVDHVRFDIDRESYVEWLASVIGKWFFTDRARVMAREALKEAMALK